MSHQEAEVFSNNLRLGSDLFMPPPKPSCGLSVALMPDPVRVVIKGVEHVIQPDPAKLTCDQEPGHSGDCSTWFSPPVLAKIRWPRPEADDAHR